MKKLSSIIVSLLLILTLVSTAGNNGSVLAQVTNTPTPTDTTSQTPTPTDSVTGNITPTVELTPTPTGTETYDACFPDVWGFVILEIAAEASAPTAVTIKWSDTSTEVVLFTAYDADTKAAFYFTPNNLHLTPVDMIFPGSETWEPPFGVGVGPMFCEPTATPTPTEAIEEENNENTTPTPTATPTNNDDNDDTEVLGATTLPDTSAENKGLAVIVTGIFGLFVGFFLIAFHFAARARSVYFHRPSNYVIYKQI